MNYVTRNMVISRLSACICVLLLVCVLALFSGQVEAAVPPFKIYNGQMFTQVNPSDTSAYSIWKSNSGNYVSNKTLSNVPFYESSNGFRIAGKGTLAAESAASVSRANVLKGLLKNAKKFGKVGGGWWGVAGALVLPDLADKGYEWMNDLQCQAGAQEMCEGYGMKYSYVGKYRAFEQPDIVVYSNSIESIQSQYTAFASTFVPDSIGWIGYKFDSINKPGWQYWYASYIKDGDVRNLTSLNIFPGSGTSELTQEQFDAIIGPVLDSAADPSPFVNASKPSANSLPDGATVLTTVPTGTEAQSVPYRNPVTGKPEQRNYKFTTNNNVTNVYTTINNYEGDETVENVKDDSDTAPDENNDSASDSSASDVEWPTASDPELTIPEKSINLDFKVPDLFGSSATCPAPLEFEIPIFGTTLRQEFSYEKICSAFGILNPIIVLATIVSCAFIVFATIRTL